MTIFILMASILLIEIEKILENKHLFKMIEHLVIFLYTYNILSRVYSKRIRIVIIEKYDETLSINYEHKIRMLWRQANLVFESQALGKVTEI